VHPGVNQLKWAAPISAENGSELINCFLVLSCPENDKEGMILTDEQNASFIWPISLSMSRNKPKQQQSNQHREPHHRRHYW
jgi:hypothetical protein